MYSIVNDYGISMNYRAVFSLLMLMSFSYNITCSHDATRQTIRFDRFSSNGDVEVNFVNFVKNKLAMRRCFAAARAQYIVENNISDASAIALKKVAIQNVPNKVASFIEIAHIEQKHYSLSLSHPEATAWRVTAYIERHN